MVSCPDGTSLPFDNVGFPGSVVGCRKTTHLTVSMLTTAVSSVSRKHGEMSLNLSFFGFLVGDPIFHEVAGITLVIFIFLFVKSR